MAGFLTTFGAFGLIAVVSVAFWSIHRFAGFFVFSRPDEGYEYVATLALAALALAALGPGPWSVDAFVGVADDLDGWVGLGVAALGVVAAAGQLALFWRRPED
jgi:putative oxidoreductase